MKGRPLKGNAIRKPTTVYMATDTTSRIDEIVKQRRAEGNRGYSRSEFIAEAVQEKLDKTEQESEKATR